MLPQYPHGIALLIGNDLCYNQSVADVTVVTRSMSAAETDKTNQLATQNFSESITEEKMSADSARRNNFPSAEILADVANLFNENQATLENLSCEKLIELQQSDNSLQSLFALCGQADSSYQLQSGVLVRLYHDSVAPPDAAVQIGE